MITKEDNGTHRSDDDSGRHPSLNMNAYAGTHQSAQNRTNDAHRRNANSGIEGHPISQWTTHQPARPQKNEIERKQRSTPDTHDKRRRTSRDRGKKASKQSEAKIKAHTRATKKLKKGERMSDVVQTRGQTDKHAGQTAIPKNKPITSSYSIRTNPRCSRR